MQPATSLPATSSIVDFQPDHTVLRLVHLRKDLPKPICGDDNRTDVDSPPFGIVDMRRRTGKEGGSMSQRSEGFSRSGGSSGPSCACLLLIALLVTPLIYIVVWRASSRAEARVGPRVRKSLSRSGALRAESLIDIHGDDDDDFSGMDADLEPTVPLIEDALPGEGIRLELVTTNVDEPPFQPTFCDTFELSDSLMPVLAARDRGDMPKPAAGSPVTCGIVRFYLADQETEFSDKIIDYIQKHEFWIAELFTGASPNLHDAH